MRGGGVRTFLDTRKGGSEKIPGLGGGSENLQASKSTGGGGGLLTDRQTDRHVFFGGLIQRKYIDYNFQISKNYK